MSFVRIGSIEVHPAANLFPEMEQADLDALSESIRQHGVRVPLVFFDGKLIDGRNRVRASVMAGLNVDRLPRRNLAPSENPYEWAWAANCARRDYTPIEKAAIRITIDEAAGELRRIREEAAPKANAARAEKAKEQHEISTPRRGEARPNGHGSPDPSPKAEGSAVDRHIAEKAKVSVSTAKRARKLKEKDPETFAALAAGKVPRRSHAKDLRGARSGSARRIPANIPIDARSSIPAFARYLAERFTSADRIKLGRLLLGWPDTKS